MSYFVVNEKCNGCLACVENCPANALSWKDTEGKRTILHNMARCVRCANCWRICPQQAIEFQYFSEDAWEEVKSLDLVHCKVCGAPLYTVDFEKSLSEKSPTPLEPLCPKHKQTDSAARQALLISGKGSN